MTTMTVAEAVGGLGALLPSYEPELWESLQPAAAERELEFLRESVAPFEVPAEWTQVLGWRNGGPWGGPWWPVVDCGHLLGAKEGMEHYRWLPRNGSGIDHGCRSLTRAGTRQGLSLTATSEG